MHVLFFNYKYQDHNFRCVNCPNSHHNLPLCNRYNYYFCISAHIRRSLTIFITYYNNNSFDITKAKTKSLAFSRNAVSCHILGNQWCQHGTGLGIYIYLNFLLSNNTLKKIRQGGNFKNSKLSKCHFTFYEMKQQATANIQQQLKYI